MAKKKAKSNNTRMGKCKRSKQEWMAAGQNSNKAKCTFCGFWFDSNIVKNHEAQCGASNAVVHTEQAGQVLALTNEKVGGGEDDASIGFQGFEQDMVEGVVRQESTAVEVNKIENPNSTIKNMIVQVSSRIDSSWTRFHEQESDDEDRNDDDSDLDDAERERKRVEREEMKQRKDEELQELNEMEVDDDDIVRPEEDEMSFGAVVRDSELLLEPNPQDLVHVPENVHDLSIDDLPDISGQGFTLEKKWCSMRPNPETLSLKDGGKTKLRIILEGAEGNSLGLCFSIEKKKECPDIVLEDVDISMLRFMDYCHMKPQNSRKFLDGFLDLMVEEMTLRGFDPRNKPLRETVSKKIMEKFGGGCDPIVVHMPVADEERVLSVQEESVPKTGKRKAEDAVGITEKDLQEADEYKALPQQIDNRERYMVDVIVFNTRNMILDLLNDKDIFGSEENLVVNEDNPFLPYQNRTGVCKELMDGTWYRDTVARMKSYEPDPFKEEVEFILPLILYVDKTGTTMNQRYPLEPMIMTLGIIKKEIRNHPRAWRLLGFIPDLETKSSAEKTYINRKNRGATAQAYHLALEHLLRGLEEVQNEGIVHWLRIGNHIKKVRIRPEVACIINDGKSADMTTLRVPSFHPLRRVSRCCETLQEKSDQPTQECQYIRINRELGELFRVAGMSAKEVQEDPIHKTTDGHKPSLAVAKSIVKDAKEKLNARSFHPVRNAFLARCIRFGLDPRNIWGANPIDLMHAFQSGILRYLVLMVLDSVPPAKQVLLDRLVHKLFHCLRSKERDSYPRLNFAKGFTKLTMITSDEWAGKMFAILVLLHTEEGKKIFADAKTFDHIDVGLPKEWDDIEFLRENTVLLEKMANEVDCEHHKDVDEILRTIPKNYDEDKQQQEAVKDKLRAKKVNEDDPEEMTRKCSANDFTQLAEALLCFHAWYKMGVNRINDDGTINTSIIRDSVARLLSMVRWFCPRKKGNGWRLQKFHDILHLAVDMERFGCPSNFDAGPMESGLKYWAKLPAMTAQTRGYNTFAKQVAMRTFEFQCFTKALRMNGLTSIADPKVLKKSREKMEDEGEEEMVPDSDEPVLGGTRYHVYKSLSPNKGVTEPKGNLPPARKKKHGKKNESETTQPAFVATFPISRAVNRKKGSAPFVVSPVIENFLRFQPKGASDKIPWIDSNDGSQLWELRTELSFIMPKTEQRTTIRCHPNFRNEGPWYDWVVVHFEGNHVKTPSSEYPSSCVPCKVLAVAENPKEKGDVWILVHGCNYRTPEECDEKDSVLIEHWELAYHDLYEHLPAGRRNRTRRYMAPFLTWVSPENIQDRCLVIEEEPGVFEVCPETTKKQLKNKVLMVRKRHKWAAEFTHCVVDSPH